MKMEIKLISISELLDKEFFIPSYQRGYRWQEEEVKALLDDIKEFFAKNPKEGDFYCLQPLVVKKDKEQYRVIDGQQRLTTIYLILTYLKEVLLDEYSIETIYSLDYETRDESAEFLEKIENSEIKKDNPDFYYMVEAYKAIKKWFENFENEEMNKFKKNLIDKENKNNWVRFIWYELPEYEDETEVFRRLNIGKIPLTNSELIKGLLILNLKEENEKITLVNEWDNIEYKLQNDNFFSFLTTQDIRDTRIDFIFNLIAKKENNNRFKENDDKFSFFVFNQLIKDNISSTDIWNKVKKYYRIFEELYNDNYFYHYIGFLINTGKQIDEIVEEFEKKNKKEFKNYLKEEIRETIKLKKLKFEELEYESDKKEIERILFLFNVILTQKSGYSKYPFELHKNEEWSLEHILAQNSDSIRELKDRRSILENELEYIKNEKLKKEIKQLLEKDIKEKEFKEIREEIIKEHNSNIENIHSIGNLALLSKKDNSSLNNAIFPVKRKRIIEKDKNGKFIPLGTKLVFLKYFSDEPLNLEWKNNDEKSYFKALTEELNDFFIGGDNE
jgi:uncharacterized protein with ParB-like and HNH nuclease domain